VDRKNQLKQLLSTTNALLGAMRTSASSVSGESANIGRYSSYQTFMRKYNDLVKQAAPLLPNTKMLDLFVLEEIKGWSSCTWIEMKNFFDLAYANTALLKSLLEEAIGYAEDETQKLKDFIQANLRKAVFTAPQKETEVQNAVESLLVGRGMEKGTDYDRETGRVKASGKESVPDFIFPNLKLCLEVKLSDSADKLRAIVDQINADIRAYATRYERQMYVVYDVGTIRDEEEFKRGLEDAPGVTVVIIKH
jgi:REase_DpnII-MboI